MAAQVSLCLTWWKIPKRCFQVMWLKLYNCKLWAPRWSCTGLGKQCKQCKPRAVWSGCTLFAIPSAPVFGKITIFKFRMILGVPSFRNFWCKTPWCLSYTDVCSFHWIMWTLILVLAMVARSNVCPPGMRTAVGLILTSCKTFSWRYGHVRISTAILSIPLIQEVQLSVNGERMWTKYW